ncbi:MAG: ATP-binding cassette domain-containing protein, partial [Bacteroidia bacterium]|nr:ATP-binding cassette domain-containing protein [Bacteroidia bacterium]
MSDHKIIFSMAGVSKIYPPNKQVLKDIYLSFFYGAKIGVLGLNGAGKSSLLRIIAGIDKNFNGEVVFDGTYKIGFQEQEPQLDETKTVIEVVREGVKHITDLLAEFDEVNNKLAEPMSDEAMNKLLDKQAALMEKLEQ